MTLLLLFWILPLPGEGMRVHHSLAHALIQLLLVVLAPVGPGEMSPQHHTPCTTVDNVNGCVAYRDQGCILSCPKS